MSDRVVQAVRDGDLAELRALALEGADFNEVGRAVYRNEAGDERYWSGLVRGIRVAQGTFAVTS